MAELTAREEIRRLLEEQGRITFARFMDVALYWHGGGYYTGTSPVGASGDYYTSPGAHPAFGALLAVQAYQMWLIMDCPKPFTVVEAGAGNGLLCHDFMSYAQHMPKGFFDALDYICLDRQESAEGMEEGLGALVKAKVSRRVTEGVPLEAVQGCLISNELLDAFPVHRVAMKDGELNEFFVTLEEGRYRDVLMELSTPALEERLVSLDVTLREGQQAEISLALGPWLEEAARALQRGYIVTVDYGRQAKDLYSEERLRGTLTSFYRHVQTDNPYQHVGEQDITAQVDFTTPVELGRSLGLRPVALSPQGVFLDNLGIRSFITRLAALGLDQKTRDANRMGMINLIRPGGLGDFKVLVQAKGAPTAGLWGVDRGEEVRWLVEKAPVPLLTGLHMPLLQGRYPHLA